MTMLFKEHDIKKLPSGTVEQDALKRHLASTQVSLSWDTLKPIIETADLTYLAPAISTDFYDELVAAYAAYPATPLSAAANAAIRKLQKASAYFAHYVALKELSLSTSDLGVGETGSTDGNFIPARQWQYKEAKTNLFRQANYYLDIALIFLENNTSDYPTWQASAAYTYSRELFIHSTEQLQEYISVKVGRIIYQQLRPHLLRAEKEYIRPTIGDEFADELKTAIIDQTTTTEQESLLSYIRDALAQWALKHAIPQLRMIVRDGLLQPAEEGESMRTEFGNKSEPINTMWISLDEAGKYFLQRLKTFLTKNAADYPTYLNSSYYTEPVSCERLIRPADEGDSIIPLP